MVLLLHGAAFTSQTWVDKVDTVRTVAAMGHRVIAIDLPGYGKTKIQDRQQTNDKAAYLKAGGIEYQCCCCSHAHCSLFQLLRV